MPAQRETKAPDAVRARRRFVGGFTYIEMMVTLAILAVLVVLATPMAQLVAQRHKEAELRAALMELRQAIDAYKRASDQGHIRTTIGDSGYPKSLDDLVQGVVDQKSVQKQSIYFLRSLPRDPMADDLTTPPADTWFKRSYTSPPDEPAEGADVFDVFSRSEKVGLSGIPYAKW